MITVNLSKYHNVTVNSLYQWDKGQILKLVGVKSKPTLHCVNLARKRALVVEPDSYEASIETAIITIPDNILEEPYNINAYVVMDNTTDYMITIPIIPRPEPDSL